MRSGVRVALAQLIALPIGCCVALGLLYVTTTSYDHDPTPIDLLGALAREAAEGDEELLGFLGRCFLSAAVAYLASGFRLRGVSLRSLAVLVILSVATMFCAGLERLWRPHLVVGNVVTAVVCLAVFAVVYARTLVRLARINENDGARAAGPAT